MLVLGCINSCDSDSRLIFHNFSRCTRFPRVRAAPSLKFEFSAKEIQDIRNTNPGIKVIGHPECPSDVLDACDFAGSTGGMIDYVKKNQPKKVMLVTECSMSDNVQANNPNVEFIKPCNLCPYMKKITLQKILNCLENESNEIFIEDKMAKAARQSVQRMTEIGR